MPRATWVSRTGTRIGSVVGVVTTVTAPPLVSGLPGDAEPGGDLVPGVAVPVVAQAGHGLTDRGVEVFGQRDHVREGFDVPGGDASGVGADDAPGERGELVVLHDGTTASQRAHRSS